MLQRFSDCLAADSIWSDELNQRALRVHKNFVFDRDTMVAYLVKLALKTEADSQARVAAGGAAGYQGWRVRMPISPIAVQAVIKSNMLFICFGCDICLQMVRAKLATSTGSKRTLFSRL